MNIIYYHYYTAVWTYIFTKKIDKYYSFPRKYRFIRLYYLILPIEIMQLLKTLKINSQTDVGPRVLIFQKLLINVYIRFLIRVQNNDGLRSVDRF